jgi:phosphinothricin acetyltransferase
MTPTQPVVLIRDSLEADVVVIQEIYAHHVLHGTASFELTPPTLDDMRQRRADVLLKICLIW